MATHDLNGLEVEVEFDYEPAQHGGMTDPSWDAYVTITAVTCKGHDIMEFLSDETLSVMADKVMADINSGPDEPADYDYGQVA